MQIRDWLRESKGSESGNSSSSPEGESPCKKGKEKPPTRKSANQPPDCNQPLRNPALPDTAMTNSRRFRRSCSLRVAKSPGLLDYASGNFYDPLEEADCTKGPRGAAAGQSGPIPCTEGTKKIPAQGKGNWRRATSLRVRRDRGEEATMMGEAAHAFGHDDGQLLIGEAQGKAENLMKKCKKDVHRAFRDGWETFVSNLYSLTLSRPTSPRTASSPPPPGAQ